MLPAAAYSNAMPEVARVYPLNRKQPEPLWREVLGSRLRALRAERKETLAETAERAGISPQYLSEIERGRKEPSSEMIAALAGALDTSLAELTTHVTEDLRRAQNSLARRTARVSSAPDVLAMAALSTLPFNPPASQSGARDACSATVARARDACDAYLCTSG
jgi:transcriptional regulator with XRE-family HTH domain